jgi:arsenate reductase
MAESFSAALLGHGYEVMSAGLERGTINPVVIDVMSEIGHDLSQHVAKSIDDIDWRNKDFSTVITVCDESRAETCPVVPARGRRLHWSFPDPSGFVGTPDDIRDQTRRVRDQIRAAVESWAAQLHPATHSSSVRSIQIPSQGPPTNEDAP